jgi:hypothetical protein
MQHSITQIFRPNCATIQSGCLKDIIIWGLAYEKS